MLGKVLGLSPEEQIEFIRALVDLTHSRTLRARSLPSMASEEHAAQRRYAEAITEELELE